MKGHPKSYLDPAYDSIEATVTAQLGLPEGLLGAIRTKGEKSNADQVSSAGARSVYQVTPATRRAALKKFGVDAYLSAENAAEVAGRILKDSLNATKGDVTEAVARYHAGTQGARGPVNRAYVARVTGQAPAAGGARPATAYDQARAARQVDETPSIAKVVDAYNAGTLDAQAAAEFEADVAAAAVLLPRGAKLKTQAKPQAEGAPLVLPAGVIQAYNSLSDMTDGERQQLDADVKAGLVALPAGAQLKRPGPRTNMESLGLGLRTDARALAGLVDIPAGGLNAVINMGALALGADKAPMSLSPFTDIADQLLDKAGAPRPTQPGEKMIDAIGQGAIQGIATAGLATPLAAARGTTGAVAKALSSAPVLDTAAGAAAGGAAEAVDQGGGGPVAQLAAALAAGGGTAVGGRRVAQVAERLGPKAAKVIEETPAEVLLDEAGELTDEGREAAVRAAAKPDDFKAAVAEVRDAPAEPATQTVRRYEGEDVPVEVIGETVADAQGVPHVKVRAQDGAEGFVPVAEVVEVPVAAAAAPDTPLPASAAARVAQAASEDIPLTRGQATQDFATQDAEQSLGAAASGEGEKARQFRELQQTKIQDALERYKAALGDAGSSPAQRGAVVKEALGELRDQGRAGVAALYKQAEDMGGAAIELDTAPLLTAARELFIDEAVPDQVRKAIKQQMAKYGLIGKNAKMIEGETRVQLLDDEGKVADTIRFTGPQERLTVANAEALRKKINGLYDADTSKLSQGLKGVIDDAVEDAVTKAATAAPGGVGDALKAARGAYMQQRATFQAKDVVQSLLDWKKGTKTDVVLPEDAIKKIFAGGPEAITNLKKVKAILLTKPTEKSRAAWSAIQGHAVGEIFQQALSPRGEVSGARLNTAIKKFGADKLKVILSAEDFNRLMKLRRIIADATIPLANTTNTSGSGYKVIQFLASQGKSLLGVSKLVPGVGPTIDAVTGLVKQGAEAARAKQTLEGVTGFTPEAAAAADTPSKPSIDAGKTVMEFVELLASERLISPLLASSAATDQKEPTP